MTDTATTLILLTYRRLPSFRPGGYEDWLVREDNPFFNAIPGIRLYENWRVDGGTAVPEGVDYFDLLYLDGPEVLEQVWFDAALTRFRRGWVARWGYGGTPAPVNANGYLCLADGGRPIGVGDRLVLWAGTQGEWSHTEVLPKHYAFPEDEAPTPWRRPAAGSPLGARGLRLVPDGTAAALAGAAGTAFVLDASLVAPRR